MDHADVQEIKEVLERVSNKAIYREDIGNNTILQRVCSQIKQKKNSLSAASETAKLWIQYTECIEVIKLFITAERVGDWHLCTPPKRY